MVMIACPLPRRMRDLSSWSPSSSESQLTSRFCLSPRCSLAMLGGDSALIIFATVASYLHNKNNVWLKYGYISFESNHWNNNKSIVTNTTTMGLMIQPRLHASPKLMADLIWKRNCTSVTKVSLVAVASSLMAINKRYSRSAVTRQSSLAPSKADLPHADQ